MAFECGSRYFVVLTCGDLMLSRKFLERCTMILGQFGLPLKKMVWFLAMLELKAPTFLLSLMAWFPNCCSFGNFYYFLNRRDNFKRCVRAKETEREMEKQREKGKGKEPK